MKNSNQEIKKTGKQKAKNSDTAQP